MEEDLIGAIDEESVDAVVQVDSANESPSNTTLADSWSSCLHPGLAMLYSTSSWSGL